MAISILGRNLNLFFTKIKHPPSSQSPLPDDHNRPLSIIKNFNSLYDFTLDCPTTAAAASLSESDDETATTPDFTTAIASQRFFFSSPGRSNSIIDSSSSTTVSTSSLSPPECDHAVVGDGVSVPTHSPDPFVDFRRSMQEMVEAREQVIDVREDWDYLHELLLCYLTLNPKSTHKFVVRAFADLLVSLMPPPTGDGRRKSLSY